VNDDLKKKLNVKHQFWETQPMPNINELDKLPPGPIEPGNLELV